MIKSAKNEALYEPYKEQFDALEKCLAISKEEMLRVKKAEFKPLLEEEIVYKYYSLLAALNQSSVPTCSYTKLWG